MAALGPLRFALRSGMMCGALILAAIPSGASAAGSPDPHPPGNARGEHVLADEGSIASGRGTGTEGDVSLHTTPAEIKTIIQHTLGAVDLQTLVREAARGAALESDTRVRELGAELDLRHGALARMFAMLGRQDVPPERLTEVLAEIVARHKSLFERVRLLEASEPRAAELRDAVAAAIETADYERVDGLLAGAEAIEFEALRQLLGSLDQRVLHAAAIYPEAGDVAGTRLEYTAAQQGALLHGGGRAGVEGLLQPVPSDRFCQWHPGHGLCQQSADSSSLCDRMADHPLCDDDRFCEKRRDHPLCDDDPPPSPS